MVKSLKNDLDNEDGPLTLDCMQVELDAKYKKICKKNKHNPEKEDKKKGKRRNNNHGAVLAASGNSIFKGRCYICRNWGYKSNQCPFRNNRNAENGQNTQNIQNVNNPMNACQNRNPTNNFTADNTNNYILPRRPRFQRKCNHCRKWGHMREDCWFLKNNQFRNAERANKCVYQYQLKHHKTELKKK